MLNRLIIFLIRKKLGVKRHEYFRFDNQASETDAYYFSGNNLMKISDHGMRQSNCSLSWLLNDDCKIIRIKDTDEK